MTLYRHAERAAEQRPQGDVVVPRKAQFEVETMKRLDGPVKKASRRFANEERIASVAVSITMLSTAIFTLLTPRRCMRLPGQTCLRIVLAIVIIGIVLPASVQAQGGSPRGPVLPTDDSWRYGYNGFRMLLEERGLTVVRDLSATIRSPRDGIVVLLGDVSGMSLADWRRLRIFVDRGGALLVASEKNFTLPGVTSFRSGPAFSNQPSDRYLNHPDCLGLTDLSADHPLTKGISELIVNKSGWLSTSQDESLKWTVVARLPDDCLPSAARGMPVLMVGEESGTDRGVFIISADQSLFSDGMLWHGDNSLLSIQVTDRLCEGNRRMLTIVDDGRTLSSYQQPRQSKAPPKPPIPPAMPPQLPPLPPEIPEPTYETLLREANLGLDAIQKDNLLNQALRDRPRNVRPVAWVRTLLLLLAIFAGLYFLWKLLQKRSLTVPIKHFRFMQSMYGVTSAKQIESSDFSSAVEVLARDFCREMTQSTDPAEWMPLLSGGKGSLMTVLSRKQRKSLTTIVQLATKGCREYFTNKQFQAFGRSLVELRQIDRSRTKTATKPLPAWV
jgi:hypothetical protein